MNIELATAVMDWHVASLAMILGISEELIHELIQCEASVFEDTSLTILSKDYVRRKKSRGRAYSYAFFACADLTNVNIFSPRGNRSEITK